MAAVMVPVLLKAGLSWGDLFGPGLGRLLILGQQQGISGPHRRQLCCKGPAALGRQRPLQRCDGKGIHIGTGQPGAIGAQLGIMPHQLTFVGILQSVEEHVIEHALVPHPKTAARLVEQIGGAAHALHPAGDHHVRIAEPQPIGRQHHRLHAGTAHLVDRGAGDAVRQACLQYRLAGGCLANPGTQHVAQIGFIDLLPLEPSFCHGRGNGTGAQLGSRQVG